MDLVIALQRLPDFSLFQGYISRKKIPQNFLQEILKQSKLALPLGVNLIVNYSITTISLTFNSHLGTQAMAAASLASATYWMFGKLLVQSLCGALDTRASQVHSNAGPCHLSGMTCICQLHPTLIFRDASIYML